MFDRVQEANANLFIEELAVLRKGFIVEPIEAVGDVRKYLHWLEHSVNIAENQEMLRRFSQRMKHGHYKDAITELTSVADRVIQELNREVSKVDFDVRTSSMVVQAGATVGAALAGAGIGNALSPGDMGALFAMCGAVAASKLTESLAEKAMETLGELVYKRSPAFLLWQQRRRNKG